MNIRHDSDRSALSSQASSWFSRTPTDEAPSSIGRETTNPSSDRSLSSVSTIRGFVATPFVRLNSSSRLPTLPPPQPLLSDIPEASVVMSTSLFTRIFDGVSSLASRVTATVEEFHQFATEISTQEQQGTEEGTVQDDELDKSELEAEIRIYALLLMRRKNARDGFREELLPREVEVDCYDPSDGLDCCDLENFRPDLRRNSHSPYNRSVAKVFARGLKSRKNYSDKNMRQIENAFLTHLKYLQRKFKATQDKERPRIKRRAQRRFELFKARMITAKGHSSSSAAMLDRLGNDAMSSDESSCDESGGKRYRIRVKDWRSIALRAWLKSLDIPKISRGGLGRKRYRVPSSATSSRQPPKMLPRAAYDRGWLGTLTSDAQNDLQIDELDTYDFNTL